MPPPFAWSVPSASMNVVLPSGLTLPRVSVVAIGTVASLPLSPLGPLMFTVSGLATPSALLQLKFPSVSTSGTNVVPLSPLGPASPVSPFSPCGPTSPFAPVSPFGPVIFTVWGFSSPPSLLQLIFPLLSTTGVNVIPRAPVSPCSPFGPTGPCSPCGPVSPFRPCAPCSPFSPGSPFMPCGPGSPFGPCGPTGPCGPCGP